MGSAFFDISVVLFTTIATVIIFFVFFLLSRTSHFISDYATAFSVIDVVKALKTICPVSSANKWRLLPLNFGTHRCWTQKFVYSILKCNINLYGSAAIVNCSSGHALREIANPSKWPEWDPSVSCQLLVKSFREKQLRRDYYMQANQVIGIQRGTNIQSYVSSYRFMNFTEKEVGWVLYWDAKKLQFMFFLMQPLINESDEVKSCLITHIFGTTDDRNSALAVQRLRNIEDFLYISQVSIMPFDLFSSAIKSGEKPNVPSNVEGKTHSRDFISSLQTKEKELPNTLFLLVPFSLSAHCTLRKLKGFKLAVKSYHKKANIEKGLLPISSHKRTLEKSLRRTVSDFCIKSAKWIDVNRNTEILDSVIKQKPTTVKNVSKVLEKVNSNEIFSNPSHICEDNTNVLSKVTSIENSDIKMGKPKEKLRSVSETVISNSDDFQIQSFSNSSTQEDALIESCKFSETLKEENVIAVDKQDQNEMFCSSVSDFEIVDCYDELSDSRITNFLTQGNYGAAELQAEILLASQLEQGLNGEDFNLAGGWAIHSYYKGMPVFIKNTTNHFMNTTSFLCQTIVPVHPKDVWKCVKNPRFRFISDETVKSVEIIEKISNAQKLIHIYHENPGFLKKELIDFCLLHTEREEPKRCYSAFHSIEYEKCPFMNSVTRGILQPSGWVVEEVDGSRNKSKVSYLIQIVISSPDSSYIHNLSSFVPQSVYNLKNYAASKPV